MNAALKFNNLGTQLTESDKITLWQLFGWQGSTITALIEPVYLSTMSIGSGIWKTKANELFKNKKQLNYCERLQATLEVVLDRCDFANFKNRIAAREHSRSCKTLQNACVIYKLKPA